MEFKTERFVIRKLKLEDLDSFYDMQSNAKVMQYVKQTMNYEESEVELRKFIRFYSDEARFYNIWAVENKEDEDFVGICGVYQNAQKENEIAYRLREQFWRKRIGREVVNSLITYCFDVLDLGEIIAYVDEDNVGSVRILEDKMRLVERNYSKERKRYYRKYVLLPGDK